MQETEDWYSKKPSRWTLTCSSCEFIMQWEFLIICSLVSKQEASHFFTLILSFQVLKKKHKGNTGEDFEYSGWISAILLNDPIAN